MKLDFSLAILRDKLDEVRIQETHHQWLLSKLKQKNTSSKKWINKKISGISIVIKDLESGIECLRKKND